MDRTLENIREIQEMSRDEMMRLWCGARAGHPFFAYGSQEWEHFNRRFRELGGFGEKTARKTAPQE